MGRVAGKAETFGIICDEFDSHDNWKFGIEMKKPGPCRPGIGWMKQSEFRITRHPENG